jgi:hypothetical protein
LAQLDSQTKLPEASQKSVFSGLGDFVRSLNAFMAKNKMKGT